ncbi:CDP-alcohol phosphatidyltransferase family protein [uncultured Clostridium sp.]|jgi:CDP-diacylglycerol--glycerol-3-phosphate 3-phosphatidyltransferase|uniref:CDP-alcohol phosphatidyltransferase family protein n=1 Tax=uncultured Clostridium sp. TaxID=59620 RepID=UPI00261D2AFA|nr:CDP-alcohol phosphatidyltransferase family protein [uncultured Clostridium sp.]
MLDTRGRRNVDFIIDFIATIFIKLKFTANNVTVFALIVGLLSSVLIYFQYYILAVILLWISGALDAVDGAVARKTKHSSLFGTLMDITFDRIVEIGIIFALGLKFTDSLLSLLLLAFSIILSMTIFLTVGALSQNDGIKTFRYQAGLVERTEAFILFSVMILFTSHLTVIAFVFAGLIFITAMQRFYEAYKLLS